MPLPRSEALVKLGRRERTGGDTRTLFYASDVHGSDVCWRKFLNAAQFYSVDALVMGGDLTAKMIVPIVRENGRYRATFMGRERVVGEGSELEELESAVRLNGFYPWVATQQAVEECEGSDEAQGRLFSEVLAREIGRWVKLADDRLAGSSAEAWLIPGNDDPWFIDPPLKESARMQFCDGQVVSCCGHEMVSLSYSNRTPWDSPRELDEEELYRRLRGLIDEVEDPARAIFNLHVPPYNSGLDTATQLDKELRPVMRGGQPVPLPVGSTAVRQVIEEYQPVLALHGHVHESRGIAKIGRTTAINSGSEYNSGRIHGALVRLGTDSVISARLVVG